MWLFWKEETKKVTKKKKFSFGFSSTHLLFCIWQNLVAFHSFNSHLHHSPSLQDNPYIRGTRVHTALLGLRWACTPAKEAPHQPAGRICSMINMFHP